MAALEKIETAIRDILGSLQRAKLYSTEHLIFKKSVTQAYESLRYALQERPELVIGIIGEELAFEKEIFFELSRIAKPVIDYFISKKIERIIIYPALQEQELYKFLVFLFRPQEDKAGSAQECLAILGVKNIVVGKVEVDKQAEKKDDSSSPEESKYTRAYKSYFAKSSAVSEAICGRQGIDYLGLQLSANNIFENLAASGSEILKIVTIKRYDLGSSAHAVNVSILAMYFCLRMGFSHEESMGIGLAALFHDLGRFSGNAGKAECPVGAAQGAKFRNHSIEGCELALNYAESMGFLPAVVAFQHHLGPRRMAHYGVSFVQKPDISAQITAVCDFYDSLSLRRSAKNPFPEEKIYEIMSKEKGRMFLPSLVESFFKIMGVYPAGTVVALSDNTRIAVVRKQTEGEIFSPEVEVIYPAEMSQKLDLKECKDSLKISRPLNQFTDGMVYRNMI